MLVSEIMLQQTPVARVSRSGGTGSPAGPPRRRSPRHRPPTSSGPGASSVTPAARCASGRPRPPSSQRHGGVVRRGRRAGGAARSRHLHRAGGRVLRLRQPAAGRGHQRPPGGGAAGARPRRGRERPAADLADVAALAPPSRSGRCASRSPPWSSAHWSASPDPAVRRLPCRDGAPGAAGCPPPPDRPAGCRSSPAPTARCGDASTFCGPPPPVSAAELDVSGTTPSSVPAPGLPAGRRPGRADRGRPVHPPGLRR